MDLVLILISYGELFWLIYDNDKTVWNQYLEWLKMNLRRGGIWLEDFLKRYGKTINYIEWINLAAEILLPDKCFVVNERGRGDRGAKIVFSVSDKESEEIKERQRSWFEVYIRSNYQDIEKIKLVICIVNIIFESWRQDMILLFLNLNKSYGDFQKLYLFPLSSSWSGSGNTTYR